LADSPDGSKPPSAAGAKAAKAPKPSEEAQGQGKAARPEGKSDKPDQDKSDQDKSEAKAEPAPAAPTNALARLKAMLAGRLAMVREIAHLPWVTITLGREPAGHETFRFLMDRHLTWPFIPHKCLGVALLRLPADHPAYLAGNLRQALRTNITRTKKLGYTCRMFDPVALHGEILAIYRSTPERQGHAVNYEAGPFAQMMDDRPERFYGIFDGQNRLRGFTCPLITGEMAWTRVFIGHHDDLRAGIMYALMSYLVQELIAERGRRGQPHWLMYDFWYGKSEGMRYFIKLCGFTPHNVRWRQAHIPPERRSPTHDLQWWERG
jgi:hypothetical protein